MRFHPDGPSIPDELLLARDEGRVLFFCGAGVSQAQANLPNFLGLARAVMEKLHVPPDSPARKFVKLATDLEPIPGVGGILAADRVFGLLERDFSAADIARATGAALKPVEPVDLSAHKVLLDLSRDGDGRVRLVTTNFDLLFEQAAPKATVFTPDRLPQIKAGVGFSGIVHLHGMLDATYNKPVGGNLILSSAEFGRAYLAEGWATDFIRAAIKNYLIVFVGYSADDPPLQYLLEALNRLAGGPPRGMYAFQAGGEGEAKALWTHKGVRAIAYTPEERHTALWSTLAAWAERARDPIKWRDRLLRRAQQGPSSQQPHERGQIVHLAATEEGARAIAQAKKSLPATWLAAFDPASRYGRPGRINYRKMDEPLINPFDHFGLDSDPTPHRTGNPYEQTEIPTGMSDVLAPNDADSLSAPGRWRGRSSGNAAELPPRLVSLAIWLGRVCAQPAALWWASEQLGLHPVVERQITFALDHKSPPFPAEAGKAWRYLLEAWKEPRDPDYGPDFDLQTTINRDGWTDPAIRQFGQITRGVLSAKRRFGSGPIPSDAKKLDRVWNAVNLDVNYRQRHVQFEIPADKLEAVLRLLRHNIEHAVDLEREINPSIRLQVAPIEPDPQLPGESSDRGYGINVIILEFAGYFRQFLAHDPAAARREVGAWRSGDPVFGRLKIWAAGLPGLLDDAEAGTVLRNSEDDVFWGTRDQRDFLLTLGRRWPTMSAEDRNTLQNRLLAGPKIRHGTRAQKRLWKAVGVLDRVTWLRSQGCALGPQVERRLARYRADAPEWRPEEAARAVRSPEGRGGTVRTDRSIEALADVALADLIPSALAGQRRVWGEMQEYDPYAGLAEKRPVRLLAALELELARNTDVVPLWSTFLYNAERRKDKVKLRKLIARHLLALPDAILDQVIMPASYWLEAMKAEFYVCGRTELEALFDRMAASVEREPPAAQLKPLEAGERRDWINLSYGSAAGHLTETLIADPVLGDVQKGEPLPADWLAKANRLLDLPGDHGKLSLVHFARVVGWFEYRDSDWATAKIASAFLGNSDIKDAALAGFFTNAQVFTEPLYALIKPVLISVATSPREVRRRDTQALGVFFASGWLSHKEDGSRWLADDELRTVLLQGDDDLRTTLIWQAERFQHYADRLTLLRDVWPLQLAARTPIVVGRLCTLAFSDDEHFVELATTIRPLLTRTDATNISLPLLRGTAEVITENHPGEVLDLLAAVLPDDVARWPYGVDQTLQRIAESEPALKGETHWIKLKRLWDAR